jgi:hypothetical protein
MVELTKEQIQFIDHRLENEGIKYWDVRIEMLDHVVSDVEKRLEKDQEFKKIVNNSFISLGWNGSFEDLNKQGWKNANKGHRKIYLQGFIDFFKNYLNLLVLGVFLLGIYFLSEVLLHKTFLKVSYGVFLSPLMLCFYLFFKTRKKKYGKSVHRYYAFFYLMLSFILLNVVMNFMKVGGDFAFPIIYHKPILFFILPLHLILVHAGYGVYKSAIGKVEHMRKQLLS